MSTAADPTAIVVDEVAKIIRSRVHIGPTRSHDLAQELYSLGLLTPQLIQPDWRDHLIPADAAKHHIDAWARHLHARGLAENTIAGYVGDIRVYLKLGRPMSLSNVEDAIVVWRANGNADNTILRRLGALQAYSKWCHGAGLAPVDHLANLIIPRAKNKKRRQPVPQDDINAFLTWLEERIKAGDKRSRTDNLTTWENVHAMAVVLTTTGCRASELTGLRHENVDLVGKRIEVFGKGSKWRTIPIDDRCATVLEKQMTSMKELFAQIDVDIEWVFPNSSAERMGFRQLCGMIRDGMERAGLPPCSPHQFRHAYATRLRDKGVPMHVIQTMLGHTSVAITENYLHTNYSQAEAVVRDVMAA